MRKYKLKLMNIGRVFYNSLQLIIVLLILLIYIPKSVTIVIFIFVIGHTIFIIVFKPIQETITIVVCIIWKCGC